MDVEAVTGQNPTRKHKDKKVSRSQLRSVSRRLVLQAVYQWQINHSIVSSIEMQFDQNQDMMSCDKTYFHELLQGVISHVKKLDSLFKELLDRPMKELNPVELAILRIGAFELSERSDIPYRVAINESIELAKGFGATASHKYVNGILDKFAQRVRHEEFLEYRDRQYRANR